MPCFYTYKYYTEEISADKIEHLVEAARRLGAAVGNITEGFSLVFANGVSGAIVRQGGGFTVSSTDKSSVNNLLQELTAISLKSTLELRGNRVEREESKGQIRFVVTE